MGIILGILVIWWLSLAWMGEYGSQYDQWAARRYRARVSRRVRQQLRDQRGRFSRS